MKKIWSLKYSHLEIYKSLKPKKGLGNLRYLSSILYTFIWLGSGMLSKTFGAPENLSIGSGSCDTILAQPLSLTKVEPEIQREPFTPNPVRALLNQILHTEIKFPERQTLESAGRILNQALIEKDKATRELETLMNGSLGELVHFGEYDKRIYKTPYPLLHLTEWEKILLWLPSSWSKSIRAAQAKAIINSKIQDAKAKDLQFITAQKKYVEAKELALKVRMVAANQLLQENLTSLALSALEEILLVAPNSVNVRLESAEIKTLPEPDSLKDFERTVVNPHGRTIGRIDRWGKLSVSIHFFIGFRKYTMCLKLSPSFNPKKGKRGEALQEPTTTLRILVLYKEPADRVIRIQEELRTPARVETQSDRDKLLVLVQNHYDLFKYGSVVTPEFLLPISPENHFSILTRKNSNDPPLLSPHIKRKFIKSKTKPLPSEIQMLEALSRNLATRPAVKRQVQQVRAVYQNIRNALLNNSIRKMPSLNELDSDLSWVALQTLWISYLKLWSVADSGPLPTSQWMISGLLSPPEVQSGLARTIGELVDGITTSHLGSGNYL